MKIYFFTLVLALLAPAVLAVTPERTVLVTYPENTPCSVIDQAVQAVKDAGGKVTHQFELIKGFAATGPSTVFEMVSTLSEKFRPWIEDDQVVTTFGDKTLESRKANR
ncbi:hypothetical protein AJ78_00032 [Emergomyces pasteurianus Ep9510]|uniref:Inhibitor I9 domain-containing protein n=1 Tax=Emergomyces pasteurianus Ep9510 TaxID=1447872 RepID=A0A1J9PUE0_9EURO|nr:hypothetical protein AJ78_00032 [Emergomyces pasteurianus Ep9510]